MTDQTTGTGDVTSAEDRDALKPTSDVHDASDGQSDNPGGEQAQQTEENHHGDGENDSTEEDQVEETDEEEGEGEDEDEDEDEDEEPVLKYARLTQHLGPVYRNGDSTSAFLVAGDKMIVGSDNGNIHVIQLPMFQSLRAYKAHSASVTSVSISPFPPPLPSLKTEHGKLAPPPAASSPLRPDSSHGGGSPAAKNRQARDPNPVPNIPSNNIYIATSSMDGNVCVQSLVDLHDVQLRNFARPVQAVALSPDYKNDRTYLSGGKSGNLILTVGGGPGKSTSTTVGTAAAAASGWLGSMGLGTNTGKDTILHSGEGVISTIKWSLSGNYVAWLNEHGIKIMRSKLNLESGTAEDAWKRIGHIDRPQTDEWDMMAAFWKGRVEWIDEQTLETDQEDALASPAVAKFQQQFPRSSKKTERMVVGWGGTLWIIHVHPGGMGVGKNVGEWSVGRAEIVKILRMDCIISGISLYTQNLLLVLAYCIPEDEGGEVDEHEAVKGTKGAKHGHKSKPSTASAGSEPSGGIHRRQNNLPPELRLIDLRTQAEVDKDGLSMSRFERLSSSDYHLGVLPAQNAASAVASSRGALEALAGLGTNVWNAAINPTALFSSGASIKSKDSNDATSVTRVASTSGSVGHGGKTGMTSVHPSLIKPGAKVFIHSPYDCILATKRDLGDHLSWLLEHQDYESAWLLLDAHPEIMAFPGRAIVEPAPSTPDRSQSDDFYEDNSSAAEFQTRHSNSAAEREKRRIGELWIQELVDAGDWTQAGQVCGKVLTTSNRWEKWVWTFAEAKQFGKITNYIPTEPMRPPIPNTIYEVVLGHYIQTNKPRFRELLDRWPVELFDINTITTALENQLKYRDVRVDSVEDGEQGRDWRIVMESLARLHEANGRHREALKCYIKLQDADSAMRLIKDSHLAEAVADDIPSFIALRVPTGQVDNMTAQELEDATSEAVTLLVDEAQHGLVKPEIVVEQLQEQQLNRYLYFYIRGLWKGEGIEEHAGETRERVLLESRSMIDPFADLAVFLFVRFDRSLLMDFLRRSTAYSFEKAAQECEHYEYVPELVYLYSKTGQVKRALYLIIDRLGDVSQAISFAKEQDDGDLWEDLLNYSMDKPRFIRGLLEEVGTAINPITLVRRIPEGLEIDGLREGVKHIMKEHEIQYSISHGVARVLQSEVAAAQNTLREGQRKGIKFDVVVRADDHIDIAAKDVRDTAASAAASSQNGDDTPPAPGGGNTPKHGHAHKHHAGKHAHKHGHDAATANAPEKEGEQQQQQQQQQQQLDHSHRLPQPGHCAQCHEPFTEFEVDTLVAFACGHVFHLTHLLEMISPGRPVDSDLLGREDDGIGGRRNIGRKVTHARLLKNRIRDGCPVCIGIGAGG